MNKKIISLLVNILEELRHQNNLDDVNLKFKTSRNYDEKLLGVAFSFLYEKVLSFSQRDLDEKITSFRILDETEREHIGIENYNYLLRLLNLKIIDEYDFENIVDEMMFIPISDLKREELDLIVLSSITQINNNLLPGSRVFLFASDNIN